MLRCCGLGMYMWFRWYALYSSLGVQYVVVNLFVLFECCASIRLYVLHHFVRIIQLIYDTIFISPFYLIIIYYST